MEGLLKRHFWLIDLLLIAGVAYTTVRVGNLYLLKEIQAQFSFIEPEHQKIQIKPNEASQKNWATTVTERNLFNSTPPSPEEEKKILDAQKEQEEKDKEEEGKAGAFPESDQPCDESGASLTLRVAMIAEPSTASYAVIDDGKFERIYKEEDKVDDLTIVAIQWTGEGSRVVFKKKNKFECIISGPNKGKGKKSKDTPEPPPSEPVADDTPKADAGSNEDKFKEGIKEIAPGKYEVNRAMLDEQISDLDNLMRQARVIPHYKQGKPAGFKVVGVRSNSIFRHLGLKSGDVLKTVGGEELTSINKALGLFEALKTNSNVSLDIERQGKPSNFEYNIK